MRTQSHQNPVPFLLRLPKGRDFKFSADNEWNRRLESNVCSCTTSICITVSSALGKMFIVILDKKKWFSLIKSARSCYTHSYTHKQRVLTFLRESITYGIDVIILGGAAKTITWQPPLKMTPNIKAHFFHHLISATIKFHLLSLHRAHRVESH